MDVEEQQVREVYGLKSSEPNIIFALCCGIRSSPAVSTSRLIIVVAAARYLYLYICGTQLRIYKADRVSMDLEKAKLEYLQASLVVRIIINSLS